MQEGDGGCVGEKEIHKGDVGRSDDVDLTSTIFTLLKTPFGYDGRSPELFKRLGKLRKQLRI